MAEPANIPTRYALVKRMEKLIKVIDDFFDDAHAYGLTAAEADPGEVLLKMRRGLIASLENEKRLGIVAVSVPSDSGGNR